MDMSIINAPGGYENTPGALKESGRRIRQIGDHAFVLSGTRAYEVAGKSVVRRLRDENVRYDLSFFSGPPTAAAIEKYGAAVAAKKDNVVVGIGGGRVLDLAKAVAEKQGVPVVTVPTIPATCAAWSALSVIYKENGAQDFYINLAHSPVLILADKEILRKAPLRAVNAGVADSVAKWYEIATGFERNTDDFCLRLQLKISKLALEFLEDDYVGAYREREGVRDRKVLDNAIDSVIMLGGLTGSVKGNVPYGGLAHQFYNNSTRIAETNDLMHGERVVFGLVVQFVVENRGEKKIRRYLRGMKRLNLPVTLADLHIRSDVDEKVRALSEAIVESVGDGTIAGRRLTAPEIADAIHTVDREGSGAA